MKKVRYWNAHHALMDIDIIKLGGSLITEKKRRKKDYREETVRRLARELVGSKRRVVIVHGAG